MVRYLTHNIWKLAQSPPQTQTLSRGHGHSITITAARHTYVFLTVIPSFFFYNLCQIYLILFCIIPSFSFPEPLSIIHSIIHTQTHTQTWCGRLIEKYLILSSVSFFSFLFFFIHSVVRSSRKTLQTFLACISPIPLGCSKYNWKSVSDLSTAHLFMRPAA